MIAHRRGRVVTIAEDERRPIRLVPHGVIRVPAPRPDQVEYLRSLMMAVRDSGTTISPAALPTI